MKAFFLLLALVPITATYAAATENARLDRFLAVQWELDMREHPEAATEVGYPGLNALWTDNSFEAIARRKKELGSAAKIAATFKPAKLTETGRLNLALFRYSTGRKLALEKFPHELLAISALDGPQIDLPMVIAEMPTRNEKDYLDIIARLEGVPTVIHQTMALLREGVTRKVTPPRVTLRDVPAQVKAQMSDDTEKNAFLVPFRNFPNDFPESKKAGLVEKARAALKEKIIPAFGELHEYLVKSYLPAARESIAFTALPDGAAWYDTLVATHTTTTLTAKQVHEIGLSEVKRLRALMETTAKEAGYKGELAGFFDFLRSDSRFFFKEKEDLLSHYRDIAKRIDPNLIKLFGKLPRLPYGVLPVPAYSEKSSPTAFYNGGTDKAGRAGYFFANTYDLRSRPKWEMEALTCHEAVPGHHLQISLAQEMQNVPEFRKYEGYNAFVEGWGLYAETLCYDAGMYGDVYSRFGQITYEMWRAVRLVVDTGMHSMGWSREKAIDFFKSNTPKPEHDIEVEVDRYITWPGQALSYKIGQLKFKELKETAKRELGARFDIRAFHDALLRNGALPLSILDTEMKTWLQRSLLVTTK